MLAQARATPSHLRLDFAAAAVESAHAALVDTGGNADLVDATRELLAAMSLVVVPCAVAARQWDLPAYASELRFHAKAIRQSATGIGFGGASRKRVVIEGLLNRIDRIRDWPARVEYLLEAVPDFLPELRARPVKDGAALTLLLEAEENRRSEGARFDPSNVLAIVLQWSFTVPDENSARRRRLTAAEAWDIARKPGRSR